MFAIPHEAPCSPHQPARATLPTATTSAKELSDPRGPELALAVESARSPEVRGFRARFVGAMPFPGSRRGHQVSPESSLLGQLCRFAGGHRREALDPLQERIKRCTARARGPLIPQLSGRRFAQAQGPRQSFHVQKRRPGAERGAPSRGSTFTDPLVGREHGVGQGSDTALLHTGSASPGTWPDGRPLKGLGCVGRSAVRSTPVSWTSLSHASAHLGCGRAPWSEGFVSRPCKRRPQDRSGTQQCWGLR